MGVFACHKCEKSFDNKPGLKNHIASRPHRSLEVVCPFCFGKEVFFRRAVDLSRHIKESHQGQHRRMALNFAGEPNCFWLCTSPRDYRLVIVPSEESSEEAKEAKLAISKWHGTVKKPSRTWRAWTDGWKSLGSAETAAQQYNPTEPDLTISIQSICLNPTQSYAALTTPTPASTIWHRATLGQTLFGDTRSRESIMRKMICLTEDPFLIQPASWDPPLPTSQTIEWRSRIAIHLGIDERHITSVQRGSTFVTEPIRKRPRKVALETDVDTATTASSLPSTDAPPSKATRVSCSTAVLPDLTEVPSCTPPSALPLGAGRLVPTPRDASSTSIQPPGSAAVLPATTIVSCEALPFLPPVTTPVWPIHTEVLPVTTSTCNWNLQPAQSTPFPSLPLPMCYNSGLIVASTVATTSELSLAIPPIQTMPAGNPIQPITPPPSEPSSSMLCTSTIYSTPRVRPIYTSVITPTPSNTVSVLPSALPLPVFASGQHFNSCSSTMTQSTPSNSTSSPVLKSSFLPYPMPTVQPSTTASETLFSMTSSRSSSIEPDEPAASLSDLAPSMDAVNIAKRLLSHGCMPLYPPAVRDWDVEGTVELPNGSLWPPKGWKSFTPDQKLMHWEVVSFSLESFSTGSTSVMVDRTDLLHKYNMLALPGTKLPRMNNRSLELARYNNFRVLSDIANGKLNETSKQFLFAICQVKLNDSFVADIIKRIELKNIPIRY